MFFLQLALLALCATASLPNMKRDIEPAEEDLMDITVDLSGIDSALRTFVSQNSSVGQAQNIDMQFGIVTAFTNNASSHILSCVSLNGPASDDDAEEFINMAEAGYVPQILDVLNQTIAARAVFANDDFVPIILRDLIAYNISNTHYLANLTGAAPPEWLPTAINITRNISAAFSEAIAAYSECSCSATKKRSLRMPGQFNMADLTQWV
ncbi:hypothetical protein C8R44DRAFT_878545 [Mycena epipterygia]|nr:hypothetical protein C8R44DRAFT_878545 [Mycena epipterygia]